MFLCRSTWQRLAPLTQRSAATLLLRNAPVRQMSSSSVPGSGGEALPYYLFLGVAFTGGGVYLYRTLSSDRARFRDRHEYIHTQLRPAVDSHSKNSLIPIIVGRVIVHTLLTTGLTVIAQEVMTLHHLYSNPLKGEKEKAVEVSETTEEEGVSALEDAAAEEVPEEEAVLSTSQEQVVVEEEATPALTEQEPASSPEAATVQVEQEHIEPAKESSDVETAPLLTASSDNIPEELASAAEDWSELSARKPEEAVEENAPAAQENDEIAETEKASESS
ncbi:protein MGARP [Pseudophryne corroboree]|uniref:protein MGARP n=1 Tax=Pseudophryne corroboree TaxID=495146 RepID=UPI0030819ACB